MEMGLQINVFAMTSQIDCELEKVDAALRGIKQKIDSAPEYIDDHANPTVKSIITRTIRHPGTPWFVFGMAFEALSITLTVLFQGKAEYIIFDFIVGIVIALVLLYYHKKWGIQDV